MVYAKSGKKKDNGKSPRAIEKARIAFEEVYDSGNAENDYKKMGQGYEGEMEPEPKLRRHVLVSL